MFLANQRQPKAAPAGDRPGVATVRTKGPMHPLTRADIRGRRPAKPEPRPEPAWYGKQEDRGQPDGACAHGFHEGCPKCADPWLSGDYEPGQDPHNCRCVPMPITGLPSGDPPDRAHPEHRERAIALAWHPKHREGGGNSGAGGGTAGRLRVKLEQIHGVAQVAVARTSPGCVDLNVAVHEDSNELLNWIAHVVAFNTPQGVNVKVNVVSPGNVGGVTIDCRAGGGP